MMTLLAFFVGVTTEGTRGRKLTQFVTNHVFGDLNFHVRLAVMHHECESDEFRNNRAGTCPGFDWLAITRRVRFLDFGEQLFVDVRAFFL